MKPKGFSSIIDVDGKLLHSGKVVKQ